MKKYPASETWDEDRWELISQQILCVHVIAGDSDISGGTNFFGGWEVAQGKAMQRASAEHFQEKRKWLVGNSSVVSLSPMKIDELLCISVLVFSVKNLASFLIVEKVIKKGINFRGT